MAKRTKKSTKRTKVDPIPIVVVQGYNGSVLIFDDQDGTGWRGKFPVLTFPQKGKQERTQTPVGAFNSREVKAFLRVSPRLRQIYDEIRLADDKGLVVREKPKTAKRRAKRKVL